jgi:hypothetical protein
MLAKNDNRIAICYCIILYAFDDLLRYDYNIPDIGLLEQIIKESVDEMPEIPEDFRDEVYSSVFVRGGKYGPYSSELEHIMCSEWIFGKEWFYGEGTFYRWRSEDIKEQAEKETFEILNVNQLEMLHKISQKIKETKEKYKQTKTKKDEGNGQ